jgi:phosphoglycolate phosphatase
MHRPNNQVRARSDIRLIALDCDGVMFETVNANTAYYNDILAHFGRPPMTPGQFAYTQMSTADEAIAHLFPDPEAFAAAQRFRKKTGYDAYIQHMEMDPDLLPLLEKYSGVYLLTVVTNRSDTMRKVLIQHGIESYFDLVVTAMDVPRPKPFPDPLFKVMDHFSIGPDEMIYVGDSAVDEQAARAAGVPLVACRNPFLDGDFHIQRLIELDHVLSRSS